MFLRFDNAGDARVRLEGITEREYTRVRELAAAGDIHDPLITKGDGAAVSSLPDWQAVSVAASRAAAADVRTRMVPPERCG